MESIQNEINNLYRIINCDHLEDIDCNFKKIGETYYLYLKPDGHKFFQ